MAELVIVRALDPVRLLEAAAEGFLAPGAKPGATGALGAAPGAFGDDVDPFPSPRYLLVLRQGGIRDDLLSLAARRGVPGWFDPPLCTFDELPEWLGTTDRKPLGDFERLVLLSNILRWTAGKVFGRVRRPDEFLDALDTLFGELCAEGITPDAFERACERRTDRDTFEQLRDDELVRAYRKYCEELHSKNRRDGRDARADCARAVLENPDALAKRLHHRREIRIFGLQDLRGGWRTLLDALRNSPALDRIVIYTSVALDLPARVITLDEPDSIARRLVLGQGEGGAGERGEGTERARREGSHGDAEGAEGSENAATGAASPPPSPAFESRRQRRHARRTDENLDLFASLEPPSPSPGPGPGGGGVPSPRPGEGTRERVVVIEAPDVDRELEEVARRTRELIDAGVPPHRIAIIARQSRPYVERTVAALERVGVPAAARLRTGYADVQVIRALLTLFSVAAEGWTRAGLVELAEHPYLGAGLDVAVLNYIGYRRRVTGLAQWQHELETLAREAADRERREQDGESSDEDRRGWRIPAWRAEQAARAFEAFATRARALDEARTLAGWVEWLTDFVERDPWNIEARIMDVPHQRFDVARLDLTGWRGLKQILGEWKRALEQWQGGDERLDADGMAAKLRSILDGDVQITTPTARGVQVLEALAVAYRGFDHVFIVGLIAGEFPLRPPRTPLLDDADREALAANGLALERRAVWEQREEELFRSLVACAPNLTLSYAKQDHSGRDVLPSWFVEAVEEVADVERVAIPTSRVLTPGLPLVRDAAAIEHAAHAARIERLRATGEPGRHNGLIQAPALAQWIASEFGEDRVWSATQIESYARCPWAYFSGRLLRLEKLEDPDEDMEPIVRGAVLHEALRLFYERAREHFGGPVLLRASNAAWAYTALEAALNVALEEAGRTRWLGHPSLRDARRVELYRILQRYLKAEIEQNEALFETKKWKAFGVLRTGVERHEVEFDDVVIERAGVRFRLRGRMDRVEVGVDERLGEDAAVFRAAVDYKTSEASTPGGGSREAWDDGVVLQVPLYAHALERLEPGARVARVEYRALKTGKAVHSLELHRVSKSGELEEQDDARAKYERALDAAAAHVQRVREGVFPAKPAESCGCPPFCHGWDICRVKGGPKRKS